MAYVVQMEQWLMEGTYKNVLAARSSSPSECFEPLLERLASTVRCPSHHTLHIPLGAMSPLSSECFERLLERLASTVSGLTYSWYHSGAMSPPLVTRKLLRSVVVSQVQLADVTSLTGAPVCCTHSLTLPNHAGTTVTV